MNFCTECGHQLKEDQSFCTECGTKQDTIQPTVAASNIASESEQTKTLQRTRKKPIAKKTKWLVSITASFIIILFGVHLFLSSYFDPVKDFQKMDQAIMANDVETFMSFIDFDETALLDKESYFQYVKTHEWESAKDQYIQLLETDKNSNFQLSGSIFSNNGEKLFGIKQEENLFFYNTHSFQAVPTKLIASTNIDNTEITIEDVTETLENTEAREITEIYPGEYAVHASVDSIYGPFTYDNEVQVQPSEHLEFAVEFDGGTYSFYTNQEDAYLFVNGENTNKKFSELDFLGPIPDEQHDTLEMHGEWENADGEIVKTEMLTLNDSGWYGIEFFFNEIDAEEEASDSEGSGIAEDIVLDFRNAYETALNTKDFSLIEPYLNNDSTAYDELRIYIGDLKDTDYNYSFDANEILDAEEIDGDKFEITTKEIFTFTNHLNEQIDYDRTKKYTLVPVEDSYQITNIDYEETNRDYD